MTRPEDREREAFEAWVSDKIWSLSDENDTPACRNGRWAAWMAWQARASLPVALPPLPDAKPVYQMECDGSWVDIDEAFYRQHDGSSKRTLYDAAETHEAWLIRQCDRLLADPRWNNAAAFDQGARATLNALREQCLNARAAIEAAPRGTGDDTARLDWLEAQEGVRVDSRRDGGSSVTTGSPYLVVDAPTIREAIDRARDAAQGAER